MRNIRSFIRSGEFFTFAAMVLMILSNIGQLTENIVARSFRYVSINTQNFESTIRSLANQNNIAVEGIFATDQSAPELAGNGLKYDVSIHLPLSFDASTC